MVFIFFLISFTAYFNKIFRFCFDRMALSVKITQYLSVYEFLEFHEFVVII